MIDFLYKAGDTEFNKRNIAPMIGATIGTIGAGLAIAAIVSPVLFGLLSVSLVALGFTPALLGVIAALSIVVIAVSMQQMFTNRWIEEAPNGVKGEDGDKGAAGDKGEAGDKGAAGDKGEAGDKGAAGDKGEAGDKGAAGDKGEAGDKGAADVEAKVESAIIAKSLVTKTEMNENLVKVATVLDSAKVDSVKAELKV